MSEAQATETDGWQRLNDMPVGKWEPATNVIDGKFYVFGGYEDNILFEGVGLRVGRGERIGIVGPNGAGKSTFCRLVTKQEEADAGEITLGHKVAPSFFSQNHADELDPNLTILETVQAVASRDAMPQVRSRKRASNPCCMHTLGFDFLLTVSLLRLPPRLPWWFSP